MTLADDLRATAVDHAALAITHAFAGGGGPDPERLARVALEVAAPLLLDAQRVDDALAARETDDQARRTKPTPPLLWTRACGDVARYLQLMQRYGWLTLTTVGADAGARGDAAVTRRGGHASDGAGPLDETARRTGHT